MHSALMIIRIRDGICTSINFNFCAWYEVEIRLSDNPRQKETVDGIIWLRRKKCVIYRLDITLNTAHVAQSIVSKINFFCQRDIRKYSQRDIRRGMPKFIPHQEVEKWQWLIVSLWHLVGMSGEIAVYAYGKASNFKLEEPRCF